MSATAGRVQSARGVAGGIAAVSLKELRGRMRGRRAFVLLTLHLIAVSAFAFFIQFIVVQSTSNWGGTPQPSDIGRGMFDALLFFLTIVVLILAPASTSGAISLEREKQTLDMLVTTPVSSLSIVLGKLFAALGWMALLLLASVPVMALVFMFGGVGPEDLLRAYIVLSATAILYGTMGLFISALFKRTQAATVLNLVLAVILTLGTGLVYGGLFALKLSDAQAVARDTGQEVDWANYTAPPQFLLWADPAAADLDVMCHADQSMNGVCSFVLMLTDRFDLVRGVGAGQQPFVMPEDSYWPKAVAIMLALSALMVLGATQLISPTRRWRRPRRGVAQGDALASSAAAVEAPAASAGGGVTAPAEGSGALNSAEPVLESSAEPAATTVEPAATPDAPEAPEAEATT